MYNSSDYWFECVSIAANDCGAVLTNEQLQSIAGAVESAHENYGMAFYNPPASDRIADNDRKWQMKYEALEEELRTYRKNAETAVKRAFKIPHGDRVYINEDAEVTRY